MPKRQDLKTILIIGSGPIVIGQACEFDYSGTQACKALQEEGYQVVLINSNPATIMTDPQFADRTYIEPLTAQTVDRIIAKEQDGPYNIDALLPTIGGQTALNIACELYDNGTLERYGVEMIGATRQVIYKAEDRDQFRKTIESIGLKCPRSGIANSLDEAWHMLEDVGMGPGIDLPAIIRPAFTLGGTGGGIAYNREEFEDIVRRGLDASMTNQILIDQSLIGWKEFELEVMRDHEDNVVIVCSIENFDPMGVHTGDSITVAPAQTLTDKEYQRMRDAAIAIMRAIGVETGGSNIQFAINGDTGELLVIEMNPRVSRSSALASKATGFPIAKMAAKLAVGHTLWTLPNDITGKTVACFEPTIDYVVTKIPRWTFEKFPEADETLTTQMKSVGEAMSIGRTFKESFQKGIRSMEVKRCGLGLDENDKWLNALHTTSQRLEEAQQPALVALRVAVGELWGSCTPLEVAALVHHDPTLIAMLDPATLQMLNNLTKSLTAGHGTVAGTAQDTPEFRRESGDMSQAHQMTETQWPIDSEKLGRKLAVPCQGRPYFIRYAFKMGWSVDQIYQTTMIDRWFLDQIQQLVEFERQLIHYEKLEEVPFEILVQAKQFGYSDLQLAYLYLQKNDAEAILHIRRHRKSLGIDPVYKLVDTCAAEFEAATPYYYSTYESPILQIDDDAKEIARPETDRIANPLSKDNAAAPLVRNDTHVSLSAGADTSRSLVADNEIRISDRRKVVILGGGPNRIGQGIEFDYCCVQAAFATAELGYESVMINSNPETVSTDYDTSDLLFFEPLTLEDVLNICEYLNGRPLVESTSTDSKGSQQADGLLHGIIVQFGGQTPLNLAHGLKLAGVPIIGTSVDSLDLAEDRRRFSELCDNIGVLQPENGIATNAEEAVKIANRIGYPVLVRPSFVLGGRAMETVFDDNQLRQYMALALGASDLPNQPILVDKFLADAIECDVDVVCDYAPPAIQADPPNAPNHLNLACPSTESRTIICGVMEHIEEAGVHSGDSACTIPPHSLPAPVVDKIKELARRIAASLNVRGLMNMQCAVKQSNVQTTLDDPSTYKIYVLEVNPRASRTVPFVSKATGVPWASIAAKVMTGQQLVDLGLTTEPELSHTSVKESVFPFNKFPGVDIVLGPEMRSTGEVMGIDPEFPIAFAKSQMAAGTILPTEGTVFLSVRDSDKPNMLAIAQKLNRMGFALMTTGGTHQYLAKHGIETQRLNKISEGRPNCVDWIKNRELMLIINTPTRKGSDSDEGLLRAMAVRFGIPHITTVTAAAAAVLAIEALRNGEWSVRALQDYTSNVKSSSRTPAPLNS